MPWCPRCDETFPEGPACPRCNARLIQREGDSLEVDSLRDVPAVRSVHVSRRNRRALERLSGPRTHSLRMLAFSIVALVFVSGFLLGRFAGIGPAADGPTVHSLPPADKVQLEYIDGSVAYVLWTNEPLATIAQHDIYSGDVEPLARFSPWAASGQQVRTDLVSFGRSVAVVASDGTDSYVAFAAPGAAPYGWVPGVEAAWTNEHELLVRQKDGKVTKWSTTSDAASKTPAISANRLFQTSSGAVAQTSRGLEFVGGTKHLDAPSGARVLAVAPSGDRALVDRAGPALWDGHRFTPVHIDGYQVVAGSFERSGERVAATLQRDGVLTIAVIDKDGNAALKPLNVSDRGCKATPAWDAGGHWLYVTPGNGLMYAVEAAGGRVKGVQTRSVGCGLAWLAV